MTSGSPSCSQQSSAASLWPKLYACIAEVRCPCQRRTRPCSCFVVWTFIILLASVQQPGCQAGLCRFFAPERRKFCTLHGEARLYCRTPREPQGGARAGSLRCIFILSDESRPNSNASSKPCARAAGRESGHQSRDCSRHRADFSRNLRRAERFWSAPVPWHFGSDAIIESGGGLPQSRTLRDNHAMPRRSLA